MSAPSQALDPGIAAPPVAPEAPAPSPVPPASHRAAANRQNAQRSTGPRTGPGKLRSSLNALRHGLTAASAVLPSEDPAAYEAHRRSFFADLQPLGALEEHLVRSLADTAWRLNRIPALEADLLVDGLAQQTRALATLGMNEARLSRQFDRTLKQLREIQAQRRDAEAAQVEVQEVAIAAGQDAGPGETKVGFVLRNNPIDAYIARHAAQERQLPPHPARPIACTAAMGASGA